MLIVSFLDAITTADVVTASIMTYYWSKLEVYICKTKVVVSISEN